MASKAPSVRKRRLAAELRRLREKKNLTTDEVAGRLSWSASKLSRIENVKIGARVADVRLLLEIYDVSDGHLGEIMALAHAAADPGWWTHYDLDRASGYMDFVALEDEADTIHCYENVVLPGLLQTEPYARYVIQSSRAFENITPRRLDDMLEIRMRRQEILNRERPPVLEVVLDESTLLRKMGSRAIMREQLQQLIAATSRPNIQLRILPLEHVREPILSEAFTIFGFSMDYEALLPDVVYIESLAHVETPDDTLTYKYRRAWGAYLESVLSQQASLLHLEALLDKAWDDERERLIHQCTEACGNERRTQVG